MFLSESMFGILADGSNREGGLHDIPIEVLHLILSCLVQGKDQLGITPEQKEAFLKTLRKGNVLIRG